MEVLFYQVGIAILILLAGNFGKKTRNIVTIVICLFTIIEVFTLKLALLQFFTIFVAFLYSKNQEEKKIIEKKEEFNYYVIEKKSENEASSSTFFKIFIVVISIISTVYIFNKRNELKKINNDQVITEKESVSDDEIYNDHLFNKENTNINNSLDEKSEENSYSEDEVFNSEKNFLEYEKLENSDFEYCVNTNLSYKYDYIISVKRAKNNSNGLGKIIDKIIISIRNKSSQKIEQNVIIKNDSNTPLTFYDDFFNCNFVISYITGFNTDEIYSDYNYGDLVVGDFNFDNEEDFAVKISNSNLGSAYAFYIKDKDNSYNKGSFPLHHIPVKMNVENKTITEEYHIGCCEQYIDIYRYDSRIDKWTLISSDLKRY
ncbi:XAC2610-related protein [Flavobacterium sp. TSSA_36]|uniref:XAC2610-related protein n=1 Tax=Flavobacterium sp. TSSA_36 TaxID=3447669 RepID=UPI003F3F2065